MTENHSESLMEARGGSAEGLQAPLAKTNPSDILGGSAMEVDAKEDITAPTLWHEPRLDGAEMDDESASDANNVDATVKAIALAQNEYNTRVRPQAPAPSPATSLPPETPKPALSAPGKKKPTSKSAPKSSASKKPSSKKRKLDPKVPANNTLPASATSLGFLSTHSPSARATASPAPSDVTDDDTLYCICRKPDNHTFMIGCDGGCEDWFHGSCVNVHKSDEDLLDKYICPNCTAMDRGVTTWKPMCRRQGCRKPARLKRDAPSKYCSDACGVLFMKEMLAKSTAQADAYRGKTSQGNKKTKRNQDSTNAAEDDVDLGPMGGPLYPHELKALLEPCKTIEEFHRLGNSATLTPPRSTSPNGSPTDNAQAEQQPEIEYTPVESARLSAIAARKDVLRTRRALLKDRERFVQLAKERAGRLAEQMGIKEVCGYDSRLAWDEIVFARWRESEAGRAAFDNGTLDVEVAAEDVHMADADDANGSVNGNETRTLSVCTKKRCERHRTWQKLYTQDVRFEEADVGNEMRRIDGEEREMRLQAADRAKRARTAALLDEHGDVVGNEDGWVEVVSKEEQERHLVRNGLAYAQANGASHGGSERASVERADGDVLMKDEHDGVHVHVDVNGDSARGLPLDNPYQHREMLGRALS